MGTLGVCASEQSGLYKWPVLGRLVGQNCDAASEPGACVGTSPRRTRRALDTQPGLCGGVAVQKAKHGRARD